MSTAFPYLERVVDIDCNGQRLLGVLAVPAEMPVRCRTVVIAVGGPQYRVGSHRQFVLLARRLAAAGYPALRFDYRGMGDSDGDPRSFEAVADDLRAAIDAACVQTGCGEVVVFGLCDAASSALMFASGDPRVRAMTLLNPWVRSGASLAATHVKHYYGGRLLQAELWRKVFGGRFDWRASSRSFAADLATMVRRMRKRESAQADSGDTFQERMAAGLRRFSGRVLLILSGNDLTAREFIEFAGHAPEWRGLIEASKVERFNIAEADHTFSTAAWRALVEDRMLAWLRSD